MTRINHIRRKIFVEAQHAVPACPCLPASGRQAGPAQMLGNTAPFGSGVNSKELFPQTLAGQEHNAASENEV